MNNRLVYIFFFLSILLLSLGNDNKIQKQQKDFQILKSILYKKEGLLNIHSDLNEIENEIDFVENEIGNDQTFINQFKLFSRIITKIQCGHTQLLPSKKLLKEWLSKRKSLPIDYVLYGKKLYVSKLEKDDLKLLGLKDDKDKNTLPEKSEIIAIDGKSITELMNEISKYISSDEDGVDLKYFHAGQFFELYRNISFETDKDSIEVLYSEKKDTLRKFLKLGIPPIKTINKRILDNAIAANKNIQNMGKFHILKNKYGYFKFVSFNVSGGKTYLEFLSKSFKELKEKNIKYLIIDLRGNLGGRMQFDFMNYFIEENVYLGKYIVNKPFEFFNNKNINKLNREYLNHILLSKIQKMKRNKNANFDGKIYSRSKGFENKFNGKIVVITDGGTFSAASILASHLKTLAGAKIAGMPAGGSFYCGNAGTLKVVLPNSRFQLAVNPNTFYSQLTKVENAQLIKQPDLYLEPINPKQNRKEEWYLNRVIKLFR